MSTYAHLAAACDHVRSTLKDGDQEKWSAYRSLSKESQLTWRRLHGHAEFCRLQRLAFHSHILGGC